MFTLTTPQLAQAKSRATPISCTFSAFASMLCIAGPLSGRKKKSNHRQRFSWRRTRRLRRRSFPTPAAQPTTHDRCKNGISPFVYLDLSLWRVIRCLTETRVTVLQTQKLGLWFDLLVLSLCVWGGDERLVPNSWVKCKKLNTHIVHWGYSRQTHGSSARNLNIINFLSAIYLFIFSYSLFIYFFIQFTPMKIIFFLDLCFGLDVVSAKGCGDFWL